MLGTGMSKREQVHGLERELVLGYLRVETTFILIS